MTPKKSLTEDEITEMLTVLCLQHYNQTAAANITTLDQVADPGRLAASLIAAIAETWAENNRRLEEYIRRVSFKAGGRSY